MTKNKSQNIFLKNFDKWKAWLYLLPALILLLIFTVYPIYNTVKLAFTVYYEPDDVVLGDDGMPIFDDDGNVQLGVYKPYTLAVDVGNDEIDKKIEEGRENGTLSEAQIQELEAEKRNFQFGLHSYVKVITSDVFFTMLRNTIILCVATVPISTFLALLIAVCLNSIGPLRRFLQTIFFMPYVTNSIAIGMVFAAMFNIVGLSSGNISDSTSLGLANWVISLFGFEPIDWINQSSSLAANYAVLIIYIVWNALPFKILILLGALQSVNKQYYDAAKVDSTPPWRVFTKITIPLLSPMISYVVITGFIGGFKEYTSIVGIFTDRMAPAGTVLDVSNPRLQTMVGYIYDAMGNAEGEAAAAAIILFFIIFAVTLVNLAVSKKNTHYA